MKTLPAALATLSLAVASVLATPALAAEGRHMISGAWLHIETNSDSEPLVTQRLSDNTTITDAGTGTELDNADTLALTYAYALDDNWALQVLGGVPPKFHLTGSGPSALVGDLGPYGKIAEVRQWSPTALALYTFGTPARAFRPFVGLGVAYTTFDDIELNPAFENALVNAVRAGAGPAGAFISKVAVDVDVADAWDPVFTLGAEYRFAPQWYLIGSVSYLPLSTTATVSTRITEVSNPAVPTGPATISKAAMDINPVVTYLGVGYRF